MQMMVIIKIILSKEYKFLKYNFHYFFRNMEKKNKKKLHSKL